MQDTIEKHCCNYFDERCVRYDNGDYPLCIQHGLRYLVCPYFRNFVISNNAELMEEFRKMAGAEDKLLMIGEKALEKTLKLYGAKIAQFRKQVYVGRQDISEQEIVQLKQEIGQLREQFYDILSHKYDRLLAA